MQGARPVLGEVSAPSHLPLTLHGRSWPPQRGRSSAFQKDVKLSVIRQYKSFLNASNNCARGKSARGKDSGSVSSRSTGHQEAPTTAVQSHRAPEAGVPRQGAGRVVPSIQGHRTQNGLHASCPVLVVAPILAAPWLASTARQRT